MISQNKEKKSVEIKTMIVEYIINRLNSLNWTIKDLSKQSKISQGELSKILNRTRKGLKAKTFYNIYSAFGDSCSIAANFVFPNLDLNLKIYRPKKRNEFGTFMQRYETSINTIEEISIKTGINENRTKDLYFRKGSLEAYELILIEKAVEKKKGELFNELFKDHE